MLSYVLLNKFLEFNSVSDIHMVPRYHRDKWRNAVSTYFSVECYENKHITDGTVIFEMRCGKICIIIE